MYSSRYRKIELNVKYNGDDIGYTIIPTQHISIKGVNGLFATVKDFSGYGVKTVTQAEIDKMTKELIEAGFDWVLKVDDEYELTQVYTDELSGQLKFTADLKMSMKNTEGAYSWSMQGPYKGEATLLTVVNIEVEGESFYADIIGEVQNESFKLYPVPKVYEAIGNGPQLVGLVPEYYIGTGLLHFKWNDTKSGQTGNDVMDMTAMFGGAGNLTDQTVAFTVITKGPFADVTLLDFNMMGPMKFQGIIVGQGKDPQKKPVEGRELELAPLVDPSETLTEQEVEKTQVKRNPDGSISLDKNDDGKNDLIVREGEKGSFIYDLDGDGVDDLVLWPLVEKE